MSRPVQAVIHLDNLRHNLALMRRLARDRTLWAVVKADAYGHGLEQALTAFSEADGLATLEVRDARFFRERGWSRRILLLEGFFDADELVEISQLGLETVVHSSWQTDLLRHTPVQKGVNVHVNLNSGMNRLGFKPEEYGAVRAELEAIAGVRVLGCVTHFANSPGAELADVSLLCGADESPLQLGSIGARIAQMYLMDVLFSELCRRNLDACRQSRARIADALAEKHI